MTIGEKGLQNPWRETGFSFMIRTRYTWNETKLELLKLFS